jgi:hypothetical protein
MITCKECGCECSAQNALGYHLRTHGLKYPDYVVKHEHGGIWPTCSCGTRLEHKKGGFTRFCSKSCAAAGSNNPMAGKTGDKSPNYGLKRTKEQLKHYSEGAKKRWQIHGNKLREMMQTPEYREANSAGQKQSYIKNPDLKRIRSESVHRFWAESLLAPVLREEASQRAIKLLLENKIGPQAPFKRETLINPWTGEEEHMHSSWESIFFQSCISRRYEVTKNHGITIPYRHPDGTTRNYIPDFFGREDRVLYEMKGRHDEVDEAKWLAAQEYCDRMGWGFVVMLSPEI